MMNNFYPKGTWLKMLGKASWVKATFSAIVVVLTMFSAVAQNSSVSGKVTDSAGDGLPGVTVAIKGTNKGTVTNASGDFTLNGVSSSTVLTFSFVGMESQEITVGGRTSINVQLADTKSDLEEVVVVGYGTQKRKEISGTVTTLSSRDFNSGNITNPLAGAQGKVAGLVITQSSGDPNASQTVRLRGTGSLRAGSEPLYVIDGVIGAPIQNIDPNDIATFDVLRDASSAAIYGARGANGVIIITTKRGKNGATSVDYNGYVGIETIAQRPELLNASQYREAATKFNQKFDDLGADTDWLDVITRDAKIQSHNVGISGGSENATYRASIGYLDQTGVLIGSGKERLNARLNLDTKALNGKLKTSYNLSYSRTNGQIARDAALSFFYNMRPTDPVYNADGSYFQKPGTFSSFNPRAIVDNNTRNERLNDFMGNIQTSYAITNNLSFKVSGTLRTQGNNADEYIKSTPNNVLQVNGGNAAARSYRDENDQLLETTLNYIKDLGNNSNFTLLGGYGYQTVTKEGFGAQNSNFLTDNFGANNIGAGLGIAQNNNAGIGSYKNNYKLISFFGRGTYSMKDTYFATLNLRRDGSTKFGANNKWGFFPSASFAVNLSKFDFVKNISAVDNAKFRISWGRTGNSEGIDPLLAQQIWGVVGSYFDPITDQFLPSYFLRTNANENLKWEVNENYGAGLDFSLFKGKLSGSFDFYTRSTKDLLYNVLVENKPLPSEIQNVSSMRNRGLETSLTYYIKDTKKFSWSTSAAISLNRNEVTDLGNVDNIQLYTFLGRNIRGTSNVNFNVLTKGQPVGVFYGAALDKITDKGEYTFKDLNGDGKIDPTAEDRQYIGDPNPFVVASITNNLKYNNFDMNFMFNGNFGNKIMNTVRLLNGRQDGRIPDENALVSVLDSKVNDNRTIPMDYYVESGNFVRLNNATIGYTLPNAVGLMRRARFYVAGNNLLLFTNYSGVDPEVSQNLKVQDDGSGTRAPGVDVKETYYKTRSFTVGVNLNF
jgi:TonB-dependent starch-binding outer membrane protein SusC